MDGMLEKPAEPVPKRRGRPPGSAKKQPPEQSKNVDAPTLPEDSLLLPLDILKAIKKSVVKEVIKLLDDRFCKGVS